MGVRRREISQKIGRVSAKFGGSGIFAKFRTSIWFLKIFLVILPDTFTYFESYHHLRRCVLGDFCLATEAGKAGWPVAGPGREGPRGVGEFEVSGGMATAGRGQGGERGTVAAGGDLRRAIWGGDAPEKRRE